jgi:hypothetical protein
LKRRQALRGVRFEKQNANSRKAVLERFHD